MQSSTVLAASSNGMSSDNDFPRHLTQPEHLVGTMTAGPTTRFLALALSIGSFTILQSLLIPVLPLVQADFHPR